MYATLKHYGKLELGSMLASIFSFLMAIYLAWKPEWINKDYIIIILLIALAINFAITRSIARNRIKELEDAELKVIKAKDDADRRIDAKQEEIEQAILEKQNAFEELAHQNKDYKKKDEQIAKIWDKLGEFYRQAKLFVGATKFVSRTLNVLWSSETAETPPERDQCRAI